MLGHNGKGAVNVGVKVQAVLVLGMIGQHMPLLLSGQCMSAL